MKQLIQLIIFLPSWTIGLVMFLLRVMWFYLFLLPWEMSKGMYEKFLRKITNFFNKE